MSTVVAIVGNKLAPGLGDHYLALTGYESQMTDQPADPNRPNNLWNPLPGDHGAHGRFSDRAIDHSWQLWMTEHRDQLALAGGALLGLGIAALAGAFSGSNGSVGNVSRTATRGAARERAESLGRRFVGV
jgi:hypothetical protein